MFARLLAIRVQQLHSRRVKGLTPAEASYGAGFQHESTSFSLALLLATQWLKVIAAVHLGLWPPAVLAKLGATADHLSGARVLPLVREIEAADSDSIGAPLLASA